MSEDDEPDTAHEGPSGSGKYLIFQEMFCHNLVSPPDPQLAFTEGLGTRLVIIYANPLVEKVDFICIMCQGPYRCQLPVWIVDLTPNASFAWSSTGSGFPMFCLFTHFWNSIDLKLAVAK